MIFRKFFSVGRKAEAAQRFTMPPSRQRQTRRVLMRTPDCGLSIIFVVAKQRCKEVRIASRFIVKHLSRPSLRLAPASGYSRSHHSASFFSLTILALASRRQAACIADFTCD